MFLKYRVRSGSSSSSAPSKQRKARIISLASIPVLGIGVLVLTWCIWQLKRQNQYVWLEEWEINYPQTQSMFFKI